MTVMLGHDDDAVIAQIVAAVFGGATVNRSILFIQGIPALLALVVITVGA